jgi:hypothetical protein
MKPRADRPPISWPPPSPAPRRPSTKPGAVRARRHRQRRKNGVRFLIVEMSETDLQSLAKIAPQADATVERVIGTVLKAAYGTHGRDRERLSAGTSSEAPCNAVCAICGAPGILWRGLAPCSRDGKTFFAHPRCFEAARNA